MTHRATSRVEVSFRGFDSPSRTSVRACFDVTSEARTCRAWVVLGRTGTVLDMQASDAYGLGTDDEALDVLLSKLAAEELARARSAAVIAAFDRRARQTA